MQEALYVAADFLVIEVIKHKKTPLVGARVVAIGIEPMTSRI